MIHRGILIKSGNHFPEDEKELYKPKSAFKNSFDLNSFEGRGLRGGMHRRHSLHEEGLAPSAKSIL